jgi:hypothetical protein
MRLPCLEEEGFCVANNGLHGVGEKWVDHMQHRSGHLGQLLPDSPVGSQSAGC